MMTQPITESGMKFGPYQEELFFHIESSAYYKAIKEDVKIAEFLLLRNGKKKPPVMWVVEAKSSTPKTGNQPNFDNFITEIREKFVNTFSLGWAAFLKRHPEVMEELPMAFKSLDLSTADVRFVLVINGHQESWLPPLKDALMNALRATIKTWNFYPDPVVVLNEKIAREIGLIQSE